MNNGAEIEWPEWWDWEVRYTLHLLRRMRDREFTAADLHVMMEAAHGFHLSHEEGRFVIETDRGGEAWEIVVEPDPVEELLIIVTAYPVG